MELHIENDGAWPLARDRMILGDVLPDSVVPNLVPRPSRGECPQIGEQGLLAASDVRFEHRVEAGDGAVALIEAGARGTGGDLVRVVSDAVVVMILAEFCPESLEFILGHPRTRG